MLLAAGCTAVVAPPPKAQRGYRQREPITVRVNLNAQPSTLDPNLVQDSYSADHRRADVPGPHQSERRDRRGGAGTGDALGRLGRRLHLHVPPARRRQVERRQAGYRQGYRVQRAPRAQARDGVALCVCPLHHQERAGNQPDCRSHRHLRHRDAGGQGARRQHRAVHAGSACRLLPLDRRPVDGACAAQLDDRAVWRCLD